MEAAEPRFPAAPCSVIASNTPLRCSRLAACSVQVRFWALGSLLSRPGGALFPRKTQGLSQQRSGGKSSPFRSSSFSLPIQAYVQVSPADLSLALPVGLRNLCRGYAGPLFAFSFSPRLFFSFFFPCHCSFPAARNNRESPAPCPRGTAGTPAGGARTLRRAAPFRPRLPVPASAWKAKDGLEIKQHF